MGLEFYSCVSDELDPVLFGPLFDGPLPVDLDAVNDPVVVEAVDTGGQVGQGTIVPDQGGEYVPRHSLHNIHGLGSISKQISPKGHSKITFAQEIRIFVFCCKLGVFRQNKYFILCIFFQLACPPIEATIWRRGFWSRKPSMSSRAPAKISNNGE